MSEHDSHEEPAISALYRQVSREVPSPRLDGRVMAAAHRQIARRPHRWWLPLSTAAVVVLAVSVLLRHQQTPNELQREMAQQTASETAAPPAAAATASAPVPAPAAPRREAREEAQPAKSALADTAPPSEAEERRELAAATEQQAQAGEAMKAQEALPAVPAQADEAQAQPAERARAAMAPQAAGAAPQRNEAAEPPGPWLKRIEAMRAKGEMDSARRELTAFRKAYPAWPLPKELQVLLPEPAK